MQTSLRDGRPTGSSTKIDRLLKLSRPSLLIIEERPNRRIVVGVPHHAPGGTGTLPCPDHRMSDENAGYLGRFLAKRLNCCSVIACNYPIDANKSLKTDYSMQIGKWKPEILVEIHGHGGNRVGQDTVEISSGSYEWTEYAIKLAEKLALLLSKTRGLRNVRMTGDFQKIHFKATASASITTDRWISYHIELPPILRKLKSGRVPKTGLVFCEALAKALTQSDHTGGSNHAE
jgi:hypothetical protein